MLKEFLQLLFVSLVMGAIAGVVLSFAVSAIDNDKKHRDLLEKCSVLIDNHKK